jgi:hypothetical protein
MSHAMSWEFYYEEEPIITSYHIIATINKNVWTIKSIDQEPIQKFQWTTKDSDKLSFDSFDLANKYAKPLSDRGVDFNIMRTKQCNGQVACDIVGEI